MSQGEEGRGQGGTLKSDSGSRPSRAAVACCPTPPSSCQHNRDDSPLYIFESDFAEKEGKAGLRRDYLVRATGTPQVSCPSAAAAARAVMPSALTVN